MKIALVHDHLAQDGGAEKVLQNFHEIWPEAPIFVLVYDKAHANKIFSEKNIHTSFIQKMPFGVKKYQWYLPFMPTATEKFNLMDYDVVLSSTSALAKGVITSPETLHICYCHTPTRYLWTDTHDYIKDLPYNRLIKSLIPFYLSYLRNWDRLAADRVDTFIANSKIVKKRINKYYNKESVIIHPPVNISKFSISKNVGNYFLCGGRIVHYKRFDIAVAAFTKLGIPLKVFGDGPALKDLQVLAGENVEFLGRVSDDHLKELYQKAQAFIFPQVEDFGIVPLESMASGRPVIAYGAGGSLETIIPHKTGIFFSEQTVNAITDAVKDFHPEAFIPQNIRSHAEKFNSQIFQDKIKQFVEDKWKIFKTL